MYIGQISAALGIRAFVLEHQAHFIFFLDGFRAIFPFNIIGILFGIFCSRITF